MRQSHGAPDSEKVPTLTDAAIFRLKSFLLQIRRRVVDALDRSLKPPRRGASLAEEPVIAESRTPLWTETDDRERHLVAGKIQNLRIAVGRIDGSEIAPGETFSFWRTIGRANRRRGFVEGREIREGCIIPTVGGGLCQLSNALYDAALKANLEIVERHPHTAIIPGSQSEAGRDATVFWNYIDLRFRSTQPLRIEAGLANGHLSVKFRGTKIDKPVLHRLSRGSNGNGHLNSCATCGKEDCFRSIRSSPVAQFGKTAFLVDEFVPEFDHYLQMQRTTVDQLFLPIDGRRFRKANYGWNTAGFGQIDQSIYLTALRSYRSRRLAVQGAARQQNLLTMYERLAADYARRLPFDALHVVVQQQLLPFLWRRGHLGGRTFDVLMTALPMAELQSRLDAAARLRPESRTLGDFRADPNIVAAETEALAAASKVITCHSDVAALYPEPTKLDWHQAQVVRPARARNDKPVIVFPATTVGRKGCYELREAIMDMDVRVLTLGPHIEADDFWYGFDVENGSADWLEQADLVVLPAFVEHRPRRLIQAAAAGIPVIASNACGVSGTAGIVSTPAGDVNALRAEIERALAQRK